MGESRDVMLLGEFGEHMVFLVTISRCVSRIHRHAEAAFFEALLDHPDDLLKFFVGCDRVLPVLECEGSLEPTQCGIGRIEFRFLRRDPGIGPRRTDTVVDRAAFLRNILVELPNGNNPDSSSSESSRHQKTEPNPPAVADREHAGR